MRRGCGSEGGIREALTSGGMYLRRNIDRHRCNADWTLHRQLHLKIDLILETVPDSMASRRGRSGSEESAMQRTVLDYLESCYSWEGYRMKRALHPKLAKRIVWTNPKTGRSGVYEYSASKLIRDVQAGWGGRKAHSRRTPKAERQTDIKILDRFKDMGVVRTQAAWGFDYLSLAKYNGQWKIINVLWRHHRD